MIITKVRIVVICWGKKGDVMIYYRHTWQRTEGLLGTGNALFLNLDCSYMNVYICSLYCTYIFIYSFN